jgi:Ca2+-binding RTX toxin-like protein
LQTLCIVRTERLYRSSGVKKQFALLVLGLVFVLVLSAQIARAAAFPNDRDPYWSYDARHVAFDREEITGATVVHVTAAATGGEERLVPQFIRGWQPGGTAPLIQRAGTTYIETFPPSTFDLVLGVDASWSPDGRSLAYRRSNTLYVSDAKGRGERQVATWVAPQSSDVTGPVWSPDGTEIAFVDGTALKVARADGSGTRTVFGSDGQNLNPSWSADGTRLAFERNTGEHWSIWLVSANGAGASQVVGGNENDRFPQFSPVSDRLAFISDRLHIPGEASPYRYALYLAFPIGARPLKLVDDVRPDGPGRWSATAAQLAVAAGQECQRFGIYVVSSAGGVKPHRRSNLCRFEGGPGNDVVRGTPYLDYLRGLAGNDTLYGGNGKNRIEGNNGNDRLFSGSGDDALFGGPGDDVLVAGAGKDLVEGGPGRDRLDAGPGDDTVEARDGFRDVIDCGPGYDRAEVDRLDVVRNCERVLRP